MTKVIDMVVRREEGVLVRVLGLIVRRGFEPVGVDARAQADGVTLRLVLTLEGERDIRNLVRQLAKLNETQQVEANGLR